jgi:hypothetical protein
MNTKKPQNSVLRVKNKFQVYGKNGFPKTYSLSESHIKLCRFGLSQSKDELK